MIVRQGLPDRPRYPPCSAVIIDAPREAHCGQFDAGPLNLTHRWFAIAVCRQSLQITLANKLQASRFDAKEFT
jgi:hypothetical protein